MSCAARESATDPYWPSRCPVSWPACWTRPRNRLAPASGQCSAEVRSMPEDSRLVPADRPEVTVALLAVGEPRRFRESALSLCAQTAACWELLIVADGQSGPDVTGMPGSIPGPRVRMLRADPGGSRSAARNRALGAARAPYILFLDEDDRLAPTALMHLLLWAERDPHAVAVIGGCQLLDDHGHWRALRHPDRGQSRLVWRDVLVGWSPPVGATMYRADVVRALGGWADTDPGHRDLLLRVSARGTVHFIRDVVLKRPVTPTPGFPRNTPNGEHAVRANFVALSAAGRRPSAARPAALLEGLAAGRHPGPASPPPTAAATAGAG